MNRLISVVIPVYNNEESLPLLFEELQGLEKKLESKKYDLELVFVDDGSKDGSLQSLIALKSRLRNTKIIKLTRNFGAKNASRAGLENISGEFFSILAADLQDPPKLILTMLNEISNDCKLVICERESREDPILKKILASIYYKIFRFLVDGNYPKRGFDVFLADKVLLEHHLKCSNFYTTTNFLFFLGFSYKSIKVHRPKRHHGKSSYTLSKSFDQATDNIFSSSVMPLRIVSLVGFIAAIGSIIYGTVIFINALIYNLSIPGYASLFVMISFLSGIIIIMLGIIGEYIWRIYDEVTRKPKSIIEKVY